MTRLAVRVVLVALTGVVLAGGAGVVWYQRQVSPSGSPGAPVKVVIPAGSSPARVAAILSAQGVISSARVFDIYLRLHPTSGLRAGDYTLRRHSSFGSVIALLEAGPKKLFDRLTIPEGFTLKQIADRVATLPGRSAAAFLAAANSDRVRSTFEPESVHSLEGLLFPDTYFVDRTDTNDDIVRRMVSTFDGVATEAGLGRLAGGRDAYQTIVVASLVESESKVDADRPKIAQVIANRLAAGIPLGIDATVIYALGGVHRATPISAAGRASLKAAVTPQAGPWIYYVKFQTDGSHKFSVTLAEQNAAIADAKRRGVNP